MASNPKYGLFVTGTDTEVGKTYVACMIARYLVAAGKRVAVYKPAASGCRQQGNRMVSDDAFALWQAAGCPATLEEVCPQTFQAPLAPHLAARAEGKRVDDQLLREGIVAFGQWAEIVVVEGIGGLMTPVSEDEYVADLAFDLAYPLVVVAPNRLGVINQTLQTLITAATFRDGLDLSGVVLNDVDEPADDPSCESNADELAGRAKVPLLARVSRNGDTFAPSVDWFALAQRLS